MCDIRNILISKDKRLFSSVKKKHIQYQTIMLMLLDAMLVNAAIVITVILIGRIDLLMELRIYGSFSLALTLVSISVFYFFGLYNRIWDYASMSELYAIIKAVIVAVSLQVTLNHILFEHFLPGSIYFLVLVMNLFLVGGSRFFWRIVREFDHLRQKKVRKKRVLIVGAGGAGAVVGRTLLDNDTDLLPIGFTDDDELKQNKTMMGIPVLGKRENIPAIVNRYGVEEILIAIPSATSKTIRELVNISRNTPAGLKIVPSVIRFIDGAIDLGQIRDINIEDLLHREPVVVNLANIAGYLRDRRVLVTGAGGTIGAELCRQIAAFSPRLIVLLGRGENSIYEAGQSLSGIYPGQKQSLEIADVRDWDRMDRIFARHRPEVVFHAAAHKHVPLMEKSPDEAFKNNIIGTFNAIRAADKYEARTFVLISTDKAVNPKSVMGATKKVAEMVVQKFAQESKTIFTAVRFGNVLGSRGSVIPLFKKQILSGGPVTVTDPGMVRYFMTVGEAVQLVIQAGAMARGGEIFLLDMGEPVKIADLAKDLIKLSGLRPDLDMPIIYTGIRPGEKLVEELFAHEEVMEKTSHERIFLAKSKDSHCPELVQVMSKIIQGEWGLNEEDSLRLLRNLSRGSL